MDTYFMHLDFNACGVSAGNPGPSYLSGTHRCRPTTGVSNLSFITMTMMTMKKVLSLFFNKMSMAKIYFNRTRNTHTHSDSYGVRLLGDGRADSEGFSVSKDRLV